MCHDFPLDRHESLDDRHLRITSDDGEIFNVFNVLQTDLNTPSSRSSLSSATFFYCVAIRALRMGWGGVGCSFVHYPIIMFQKPH